MTGLPRGRRQRQTKLGGVAETRGTIPRGPVPPIVTGAYDAPKARIAAEPTAAAPLFYGKQKRVAAKFDKTVPGKRRVAKPRSPRAMAKHFERFLD